MKTKTRIRILERFINKFQAVADDQWCEYKLVDKQGRRCVLGHCGFNGSLGGNTESALLGTLFKSGEPDAAFINDGRSAQYQQPHPKLRILAALNDLLLKELANLPPPAPQPASTKPPPISTLLEDHRRHRDVADPLLAAGVL